MIHAWQKNSGNTSTSPSFADSSSTELLKPLSSKERNETFLEQFQVHIISINHNVLSSGLVLKLAI